MIWKPTKVQEKALASTADEVLFGGSRGGGKTDTALQWLMYDIENPKLRQLVIRRNATDLSDFVDRARQKYTPIGAIVKGNPCEIHFPSGAVIYTGHLATPDAYTKYQGWEIHRLLMEEVTHIPSEKLYEKLLGSVRSTVDGIKTQIFLTTNPGGAGHSWVKERFEIGIKESGVKFERNGRTFIYVPATIHDNPHLLNKDPAYLNYLNGLPEALKQQWLYGDWSEQEIDGAYYAKQFRAISAEKRITNVPIESTLPVHTYWDLGISDAMSIWFVQDMGKEQRIINYYENSGEGLVHYINYLHDFRNMYGFVYGEHYAPHDIQVRELTTGRSRLETASSLGINFNLVPNKSVADGIEAVRHVLPRCWFDAERCKDGINALRNYHKEWNERLNTYSDKPLHNWASHGSDAFRMFAIAFDSNTSTSNDDWSVKGGW